VKKLGALLWATASAWMDDKASLLGAAIAYYIIIALAPLLLLAIAVASFIYGEEAAKKQIVEQSRGMTGDEGGQAVGTMLDSAHAGHGILATVIGIAVLLFGAMGLFIQLQDAMNSVWGVRARAGRGVWKFFSDRLLSFGMVAGTLLLLLASLIVSGVLAAVVSYIDRWQTGILLYVANATLSVLVITLLFAMLYRFLPDVQIAWRDVWLGAALTAVLFEIGKFLIGFYLGRSGVASAYGAAGSLVALLVWFYYSAQIFLFGAEFTKIHARRRGSKIVPTDNAEFLPYADQNV
jgi:membrane protein